MDCHVTPSDYCSPFKLQTPLSLRLCTMLTENQIPSLVTRCNQFITLFEKAVKKDTCSTSCSHSFQRKLFAFLPFPLYLQAAWVFQDAGEQSYRAFQFPGQQPEFLGGRGVGCPLTSKHCTDLDSKGF